MGPIVCFKDFRTKPFIQALDSLGQVYKDFKLRILNNGDLTLEFDYNSNIVVFQLRDDILSFVNSKTPKFDFVFYQLKNPKYKDENGNSDEEVDRSDDSNSNTDESDSSSCTSSDSVPGVTVAKENRKAN